MRHKPLDRVELERVLEHLHADSWGWALACTSRDRDVAHDALQTAYARVLSGAARFDGASNLKTWLFGVIRLTSLEELRRGRRTVGRDGGCVTVGFEDPAPRADALTEQAERAAVLERALALLSDRQREVIQLVFYHEMTIEEAAVVMRVSLGAARTHYDRAKKSLAAALRGVQEELR